MPVIRRHDHTPRLELMPLLDVVFLLLTFFIYSFVLMIRADALPIQIAPVSQGSSVGSEPVHVLSIDAVGRFAYAGQPLPESELDPLLERLASDPQRPTLYISLDANSETDRGPKVWQLMQRVGRSGLTNLVFVGSPGS